MYAAINPAAEGKEEIDESCEYCCILACDGPSNGLYIGHEQAIREGYSLERWPTGEFVWMQPDV